MDNEESEVDAARPTEGPIFLVVDDDPMVRRIVARGLGQLNPAEIIEEEDGLAAQAVLKARHVDVVVTDVMMPKMDGLALMKWAKEHCPEPLWIVLSGLETFDAAVDALQRGAFDYLAKPPEVPRVRVAVRNALDQLALVRERKRLYAELEDSNVQLAERVDQLQRVCRVLEDQASVIQADLDRAEIIQRALLPQEPPIISGWCMETLYRPGSSVGGDFYDAVVLGDGQLGLVIADAAGHGVAAAMLAVLFKLRLKQTDSEGRVLAPETVLQRLNNSLYGMLSTSNAFITAAYMLIDLRSGQCQLASAGHPACIVMSSSGDMRTFARTGPALGLENHPRYSQHVFQLDAGDRLMLYTDGILDGGPASPSAEDLAAGMAAAGDRAELLTGFFHDAVRCVSGDRDDITMLLLERCEGVSHFDDAAPLEDESPDAAIITESQAATEEPHLLQGTQGEQGFIAIVGSITWLCGQTLLEAANNILSTRDTLTLDFERCEHLDSTCLGTLHEIVTSHPDSVTLQAVSGDVRKLFDELSMRAALDHIGSEKTPLPEDMALIDTANLSPQEQGARILSAHETLSSLSDENREQFRAVVDSLRADLPEGE